MAQIESVTYKSRSPLAACPVDGLFIASGAVATGNALVRFAHVSTNCPKCGANSEILPGLYTPDGDNIRLLVDQSISPNALESLKKLVMAVQSGEISPDYAQREAEKVHHGWGKFFNVSQWSDQAKATLFAAIISGTTAIVATRISSPPTVVIQQPAITRVVTERNKSLLGSTSMYPFVQHGPRPRPEPHHRKRR
jgi:hypothetical protein